jgi:hypothetical protein
MLASFATAAITYLVQASHSRSYDMVAALSRCMAMQLDVEMQQHSSRKNMQ